VQGCAEELAVDSVLYANEAMAVPFEMLPKDSFQLKVVELDKAES